MFNSQQIFCHLKEFFGLKKSPSFLSFFLCVQHNSRCTVFSGQVCCLFKHIALNDKFVRFIRIYIEFHQEFLKISSHQIRIKFDSSSMQQRFSKITHAWEICASQTVFQFSPISRFGSVILIELTSWRVDVLTFYEKSFKRVAPA